MSAVLKSACASWSACLVARRWKLRFSRKPWNLRVQKKRSRCRALCHATLPDEGGHRHPRRRPVQRRRTPQRRASEARTTDTRRRPCARCRNPPPRGRQADLVPVLVCSTAGAIASKLLGKAEQSAKNKESA